MTLWGNLGKYLQCDSRADAQKEDDNKYYSHIHHPIKINFILKSTNNSLICEQKAPPVHLYIDRPRPNRTANTPMKMIR